MFRTWISLGLVGCWAALSLAQDAPKKRVLTHADYDIWNTATGVTLSPNGLFVAYVQSPAVGDATIIVKNLSKNTETKITSGGRTFPASSTAPAGDDSEDQLPAIPAIPVGFGPLTGAPQFTPDSKFLYFPLVPTKAEAEKAKADKKDAPRTVLAGFDLSTEQITQRIESLKTFTILGDGAGVLVMTKEPKPEPKVEVAPMPKSAGGLDQQPGKGGNRPRPTTAAVPGDLVIRRLSDGKDFTFPEVVEFTITADVKHVAYVSGSKKPEAAGLYFAELFAESKDAIKAGAGKYSRMTWDDKQTKLEIGRAHV